MGKEKRKTSHDPNCVVMRCEDDENTRKCEPGMTAGPEKGADKKPKKMKETTVGVRSDCRPSLVPNALHEAMSPLQIEPANLFIRRP